MTEIERAISLLQACMDFLKSSEIKEIQQLGWQLDFQVCDGYTFKFFRNGIIIEIMPNIGFHEVYLNEYMFTCKNMSKVLEIFKDYSEND